MLHEGNFNYMYSGLQCSLYVFRAGMAGWVLVCGSKLFPKKVNLRSSILSFLIAGYKKVSRANAKQKAILSLWLLFPKLETQNKNHMLFQGEKAKSSKLYED